MNRHGSASPQRTVSLTAANVARIIAEQIDRTGTASPRVAEIAATLGLTERQTRAALRELVNARVLRVAHRHGEGPTAYRLPDEVSR